MRERTSEREVEAWMGPSWAAANMILRAMFEASGGEEEDVKGGEGGLDWTGELKSWKWISEQRVLVWPDL